MRNFSHTRQIATAAAPPSKQAGSDRTDYTSELSALRQTRRSDGNEERVSRREQRERQSSESGTLRDKDQISARDKLKRRKSYEDDISTINSSLLSKPEWCKKNLTEYKWHDEQQ